MRHKTKNDKLFSEAVNKLIQISGYNKPPVLVESLTPFKLQMHGPGAFYLKILVKNEEAPLKILINKQNDGLDKAPTGKLTAAEQYKM